MPGFGDISHRKLRKFAIFSTNSNSHMPRQKLSDELKEAISRLPGKEKDKLLFRLVAKDEALVEKLSYQLLEGSATQEERREDLKKHIQQTLREEAEHFYSPGYLLLDLRSISGQINRHVKTTRDKYGEIELNLFMLNYTLQLHSHKVERFSKGRRRTLDKYIIQRVAKLHKLLDKLHEDYQLDFEEDFEKLHRQLRQDEILAKMGKEAGLEV